MRKSFFEWEPRSATASILNAAMAYIQSVPYKVGLRWVFYRLLQDGHLSSKAEYGKLKDYAAKARKTLWNGWHPSTLVDEGREVVISRDPVTAADALDWLPHQLSLAPDIFTGQECIPFLLFEAATMVGQFDHFAGDFDRAALRGDASIPHKWNITERMNELHDRTGLPIHVLYFGDLDPKGLQIPESANGRH